MSDQTEHTDHTLKPDEHLSGDDGATLGRMIEERRQKCIELRKEGHEPYANDFIRSTTCNSIRERYGEFPPEGDFVADGEKFRISGRAMGCRGFGKTMFVPIRDYSGELQLYLNIQSIGEKEYNAVAKRIDVGDILGAEGEVFWTKKGELSLRCCSIRILTKSLRPLPEKWHGLTDIELRYRQRYLDMIVNPQVRDVFHKRSKIIRCLHNYLDGQDFLEVETPMMHASVGGASAKPFGTHHNALDMDLYLRIAPELHLKRLIVGGFERVYEMNRNFRNEGLSSHHNPEFTTIEFYQAYATADMMMDFVEALIVHVATDVMGGKMKYQWSGHCIDLTQPWNRLSIRDALVVREGLSENVLHDPRYAIEAALNVGVPVAQITEDLLCHLSSESQSKLKSSEDTDFQKQLATFADTKDIDALNAVFACYKTQSERSYQDYLQCYGEQYTKSHPEHYENICERIVAGHLAYRIFEHTQEEQCIQPTFVTDFPLGVSPLARKKQSDPAFCDRFELFVAGKEIANAFSELNDPDDQRERFIAQIESRKQGVDETMDYDEDYCRALEIGMPPTAGVGIGIDRLVMLLTEQSSIKDVILFPLTRKSTRK